MSNAAMKQIVETNRSTLIGLAGGALVLAVTAFLARDRWMSFINLPGLVTVLGGTLAATLVSRPVRDVLAVFKSLRRLMRDEQVSVEREIAHLVDIAHWYRAGNVRAAEAAVHRVDDALLRTGAQLVIDREPIDDIVKLMHWHIAGVRARASGDVQILRTLAAFAPVFGMVGTLFGLIQLLDSLGHATLADIGSSMSFALMTTLYGLVLANMVFKPLAIKLERSNQQHALAMNMILEGVVLLHARRHPMQIREALAACLIQSRGTDSTRPQLAKVA